MSLMKAVTFAEFGGPEQLRATEIERPEPGRDDVLVRIHAATAGDPSVAAEFPTDAIFYDIRLEPYLVATARAHPDQADIVHQHINSCKLELAKTVSAVGPLSPSGERVCMGQAGRFASPPPCKTVIYGPPSV